MSEKDTKDTKEDEALLHEARFMGFVSMMADTVMQHLGKTVNPITDKVERNLPAAKATIDLLMTMKEKTKGNLSKREDVLLSTTLSNLQMNYVDEIKKEEKEESKSEEEKKSPG